jgi:hypothetical protein
VITALVLLVAYAAGVDPRRLVLLAGAVYLPLVVAALLALYWYRARSNESNRPSLFCESVSAELRAGATLRDALASAATSVGCDPIPPHSHMAEVAARLAQCFPAIGEELRLTVVAAARTGSDSAGLFDEIGSLALAQSEISREVRVAAAPGRATALLLVGAPLVYVVSRLGSGGISEFLASSEQRLVALLGMGMFLLGLTVACVVLWRASR